MKEKVLVVGDGVLAGMVREILSHKTGVEILHHSRIEEQSIPADTVFAIVLNDGWDPGVHILAEQVFRQRGIPWMRAFVALGQGIIGPVCQPGVPGCSQCADMRWMMAESDRNVVRQLRVQLAVHGGMASDAFSSTVGLYHMALSAASEVMQQLTGESEAQQESQAQPGLKTVSQPVRQSRAVSEHMGSMLWMDMRTLSSSWHLLVPIGTCPVCGYVPDDSAQGAQIELNQSPKAHPRSYRDRNLAELKGILSTQYLDTRAGLLNEKVHDLITPFAAVSTNLPLAMGDEGTSGRGHAYPQSETTAILEGLERYCGLEPRGKKTGVRASYASVRKDALNPREVGLHHPHQYAKPDFPFHPFDEQLPIDWVWGYSLIEQRPVLVPKRLAYYSLGFREGFVYETSNGCALGGSMSEAVFHGMLEVVERDAFLMTWYAQLPLIPVNAQSAGDLELDLMLERLSTVTGYEVYLYNATMEHGIPSVFAIAKNKRTRGMNLICAAGAHVDALRAVKGAVHELAGMLLRFDDKLEENRGHYLSMYHDADNVRHMDDHSMLYGLKEAEHRLGFLLESKAPEQSFADAFPGPQENECLYQDALDLLSRFRERNMNVIVVNQTSPEIERNGLYCVKVIIPGMLPMTFGHSLVRLEGLNRVRSVPMLLGYAKEPLSYDQLNPYPHPFC